MNLKYTAALVALLSTLGLFFSPASAQLTRVNVGYSALSGDQLPLWIGKEFGIFEKEGLDVIPLKLRHSKLLGGGPHCVTLDVRRRGKLERYFD